MLSKAIDAIKNTLKKISLADGLVSCEENSQYASGVAGAGGWASDQHSRVCARTGQCAGSQP